MLVRRIVIKSIDKITDSSQYYVLVELIAVNFIQLIRYLYHYCI
jgi:hypothetical protein